MGSSGDSPAHGQRPAETGQHPDVPRYETLTTPGTPDQSTVMLAVHRETGHRTAINYSRTHTLLRQMAIIAVTGSSATLITILITMLVMIPELAPAIGAVGAVTGAAAAITALIRTETRQRNNGGMR